MMSNTDYTEALETLVQQFSDLVKFHEIEALGEWIEQIHQANMHEMT
jgi:hypothetical protein